LESQKIDLDRVLLPPRTWQQELTMPERHQHACKVARELGLNKIIPANTAGHAPIGFVTTGMSDTYLRHVLRDTGLAGRFPVLHLGMCYPVDAQLLAEFGQECEHMIVLEERRSFVEKNLRDAVQRELPGEQAVDLTRRLFGKKFPGNGGEKQRAGIPETRGLNPSLLLQLLAPMLKEAAPDAADRIEARLAVMRQVSRRKLEVLGAATAAVTTNEKIDAEPKLPARTPTFCPGCPHRDSSALLLEVRKLLSDADYMRRNHKRGPVDLIAHGDTGCYTMLMFPPTEQLMHNYSGMGLGGGTGSGIDAFLDPEKNKQIVFMGDGTFFHSGQVAIANAVAARQDLTFIILQNGTTAMTGHQGHAATELDLLGDPFPMQEIESIVRGVQGASVFRADPADRDLWKTKLEQTILAPGVKVLIADKECGITLHRRKKREESKIAEKHGYLPVKTHMNITPEVCEHCLECTKATACPGLKPVDTDYGRKIDTDLTWCVNDGACERVRVTNEIAESVKPCPSFEEVKIIRGGKAKKLDLDVSDLPDPTPRLGPDDEWRCHLTGVGGMGVGTV
ncbi:MAG: thiamine pyrophosphate-dependent enzyme, partial [Planctomycetota bacterium]